MKHAILFWLYEGPFTDRQGNILSVIDESGRKVFDATYDAWGKQTVTLWRHRSPPRLHGPRDDGRVRAHQHEPKVTGAKRGK